MIRVLHILGCADAGGISSVVLNYYQFLDRSQIQFDLALTVPRAGQNVRAMEALGARVFFIPLKAEDREGYCRELKKLLTEGHYDALHVHESETCYVALKLARQLGIPCRIAHAHTSSPYEGPRSVVRRLSGVMLNLHYATHAIACGELAGQRVFGKHNMKSKKALVLPNAVDTRRFAWNPEVREQVRKELGVEDGFVLGMVTRLSEEKNVAFGPALLGKALKTIPNAVLLIAGNGDEEDNLKKQIAELGLNDKVRLLGRRADVERLYQAYDVFLLPSIHEGFPVAAVEALSSGLPALLSDTITRELEPFTGVSYLPLGDADAWVRKLEALALQKDREEIRAVRQQEPRQRGLDIRSTAGLLAQIYEEDVRAGRK